MFWSAVFLYSQVSTNASACISSISARLKTPGFDGSNGDSLIQGWSKVIIRRTIVDKPFFHVFFSPHFSGEKNTTSSNILLKCVLWRCVLFLAIPSSVAASYKLEHPTCNDNQSYIIDIHPLEHNKYHSEPCTQRCLKPHYMNCDWGLAERGKQGHCTAHTLWIFCSCCYTFTFFSWTTLWYETWNLLKRWDWN